PSYFTKAFDLTLSLSPRNSPKEFAHWTPEPFQKAQIEEEEEVHGEGAYALCRLDLGRWTLDLALTRRWPAPSPCPGRLKRINHPGVSSEIHRLDQERIRSQGIRPFYVVKITR